MAKRRKKLPLSRYPSQWSPWYLTACSHHFPAPKIKAHWVRVNKTPWIGVDTQKRVSIHLKCIIKAFLPHNSVLSFLLISRYIIIIIIIIFFDEPIKMSITLTTNICLLHREHVSLACKKTLNLKMFNIKLASCLHSSSKTARPETHSSDQEKKKKQNTY